MPLYNTLAAFGSPFSKHRFTLLSHYFFFFFFLTSVCSLAKTIRGFCFCLCLCLCPFKTVFAHLSSPLPLVLVPGLYPAFLRPRASHCSACVFEYVYPLLCDVCTILVFLASPRSIWMKVFYLLQQLYDLHWKSFFGWQLGT